MKRLSMAVCIFIVGAILLAAAVVRADGPFIRAKATTMPVESYTLIINDGTEIQQAVPLNYDCEQLDPGTYVMEAIAHIGVWGSVPSVPLSVTKPNIVTPVLFISTKSATGDSDTDGP